MDQELGALIGAIPEGWTRAEVDGEAWGVTRVTRAEGKVISCWDNTNNSCRIARTVLQHSNQRSVGQVSPHMVFERESDSLPRDGCRHDQVVKDELPFRLAP